MEVGSQDSRGERVAGMELPTTVDIVGLRNLADNLRPEYPVTMDELDKALDCLEAAQRTLEAARTALDGVEWCHMQDRCPWCVRHAYEGHAPECLRQQALAEIAGVLDA